LELKISLGYFISLRARAAIGSRVVPYSNKVAYFFYIFFLALFGFVGEDGK
jgi:hypothetical protein